MDTALTDRFEIFDVEYDHLTFLHHIESQNWHTNIVRFIKSGIWVYKTPDSIAKESKYISPRTWSKMNAAEQSDAGSNRAMHRVIAQSILGKHIGNEYWKACWDDAPVTAADLLRDKEKSLQKLREQSKATEYHGDKIPMTVESIVSQYGGWYEGASFEPKEDMIDEATMVEVAMIIPSDQAICLIRDCGYKTGKGQITTFFKEFTTRNPQCVDILRSNIRIERTGKNKS